MRIAVEGNIGAGKSTVLDALGGPGGVRGLGVPVLQEPLDQWGPLLDAFYASPSEFGLAFSLKVLAGFDAAHRHETCIVERCPLSCRHVFTQMLFHDGHLTQEEWDLFKEYADTLGWAPDAIVYIDTPAHVCLERVRSRARACEAQVDLVYMRRLEFQYDTLLKYCQVPVVRLDGQLPPAALAEAAVTAVRKLLL
jgi:deoxyadenosine/deoxycytidine kinase